MKQNRICFLAAAAAVLLGTAACNTVKEKEFDPTDPAIYTVTVQPDGSVFKAEGEELVFNFNAPDYWFVSSPVDWLEFEPESGKPGDVTLRVKAKQNIKGERNALITVNAKKQRGKFSVSQEAWPYYHEWIISGNVGGSSSDQDIALEDQGDQLVWNSPSLASHTGESFLFRMTGSDPVTLGLQGALVPAENANNTFTGALKKDGERITLPIEGYWEVTLDVEHWTMTAALAGRYPWTLIGTVNGGDWNQDFTLVDMGSQLKWEITKLPFHNGEEFRFRREGNDIVNLGIDGEFTPVEGAENTYVATLKQDGGNITLPAEGFWDLSLDVESQTLTAVFNSEFPKPVPNPLPWNWEALWLNDGSHGEVAWNGIYRFGLEGNDGNNECVATFPQEVWDRIKNETIYVYLSGENPQIRVTTGWWEAQLTPTDIQPGNALLADNEAYTWILTVNVSSKEDLFEKLDSQHLLFTGNGYTVLGIYAEKKGVPTLVKNQVWTNDGSAGEVAWNNIYRFCLEGRDPSGTSCIAEFPADVWARIKSETFYATLSGASPQIRVTTGWWEAQLTPNDIQPGHELLTNNGDGTWTLKLNLSDSPELIDKLDDQHLLFTGGGFTLQDIYVEEIQWIPEPVEIDIAPFTYYEDRSATLTYPYYPSWGDNSGKLRIMRGGNPAIESLGLTTSSKFIVYKEVGTTGQIQFNTPNWGDLNAGCNDWDGSAEKIEVPVTEDMLKCISGEVSDGWGDTAIILQGDGLKVTKIVIVP